MKTWSYTLSTNTIWFDLDFGTVTANNKEDATALAKDEITLNLQLMNKMLNGFAKIEVNLDNIEITENH